MVIRYLLAALSFCAFQGCILGEELDLSSVLSRLFSVTCEGEEELFSDWTRCVWPSGDLRPFVVNFTRDAKSNGCKMPPPRLIKVAIQALKNNEYISHPLYQKIPSTECGICGRKAQCCTKSRSFLTQSFRSDRCDGSSAPCEFQPINAEDRTALTELYGADFDHPTDDCGFNVYVNKELDKLQATAAFKFVKPLMCQVLGTTRPSFSCVKSNGKCHCCCLGYKPENGECVPDTEADNSDPNC